MKLYLSSEGLGNKRYILEEWKKQNGNKVLVIPNAKDYLSEENRKKKIIEKTTDLIELGFEIKVLDLKKYFNSQNLQKDIKDYKCFFVMGGNVFILRQAMYLSGFDTYLKQIANKEDYLYIGYSAGSCVLSPTLKGLDIVDNPINPYNKDKIIFDGLGLIDYIFIPHYKSNNKVSHKMEKVVEMLRIKKIKYKTFNDIETIIEDSDISN